MKKITLLLLFIVATVSLSAQRISALTIEGVPSCVPFASFTPTNNSLTVPGDGQIIYPDGTDLSNVNVSVSYGTEATLDAPVPWPTDWTNTITGVKITSTVSPFNWALYNITLKKIKPAALPLEIKTGTGNFDSNSWTTSTVGWAGACIDKTQTLIRLGSAKRSFMVAFSNAPDSLIYTIKALGTWAGSNNIFDVDGSVDGISWTSIVQYNATTPMPPSSPAVIARLKIASEYRFIRWIYTTRNAAPGNFNVSLENIMVTKDTSTGVMTPMEQGVKIFSAGNNTLHLDNADQVKSLKVYHVSGAKVLDVTYPSTDINVNSLVPGVYISEIGLKSGNVVTTKFFK